MGLRAKGVLERGIDKAVANGLPKEKAGRLRDILAQRDNVFTSGVARGSAGALAVNDGKRSAWVTAGRQGLTPAVWPAENLPINNATQRAWRRLWHSGRCDTCNLQETWVSPAMEVRNDW